MTIQTVSSRIFNQDPTAVKRAALSSPVQITDRGKVSHVLVSIEIAANESNRAIWTGAVERFVADTKGDDRVFKGRWFGRWRRESARSSRCPDVIIPGDQGK